MELLSSLEKELKDEFSEFKKEISEKAEKYVEQIATEVSLLVVGESYSKWDSISSFFPTLTFVFNEVGSTGMTKRTQIKTRLPKRSEDLTDSYILNLQQRIKFHENWTYTYGLVRSNFVSADKRWKTTIFTNSEGGAKTVLATIGTIIEEEIDFDLLTFTTSRKRRPRITARTRPLFGVGLNPISYEREFNLKLRRAVLLVNNLEKPIQLFP